MIIKSTAVVAAIAGLGVAAAAPAQTFTPDGPRTVTGDVTVRKGISLDCSASGTGGVTGGAARVDSLTLSGGTFLGNCADVVFSGFPYAITANSPTSVTISGVQVTGITGSCAGSVSATYDQSTGEATFNDASLPTTTGGSNCSISGSLFVDPPASIVF